MKTHTRIAIFAAVAGLSASAQTAVDFQIWNQFKAQGWTNEPGVSNAREAMIRILEGPTSMGGYGITDLRTILAHPEFFTFVDAQPWATQIFEANQIEKVPVVIASWRAITARTAIARSRVAALPQKATPQQEHVSRQLFGIPFNDAVAAGVYPEVWMTQTRDTLKLKQITALQERVKRFYAPPPVPSFGGDAGQGTVVFRHTQPPDDNTGSGQSFDLQRKMQQLESKQFDIQHQMQQQQLDQQTRMQQQTMERQREQSRQQMQQMEDATRRR